MCITFWINICKWQSISYDPQYCIDMCTYFSYFCMSWLGCGLENLRFVVQRLAGERDFSFLRSIDVCSEAYLTTCWFGKRCTFTGEWSIQGMNLTNCLHLTLRLGRVDLNLHCPVCLCGVHRNSLAVPGCMEFINGL